MKGIVMVKEEIELPDRSDLIGQNIRWQCGSYKDANNQQDHRVVVFAPGVITHCEYDQFNDQFKIKVHFVQYKKWKKWGVPEHKDLLLSEIELESGFKFRA